MNGFFKFWNRLCDSTAQLKDEENKMTISVASFKKQMQKAYSAGFDDKEAIAKVAEEFKNVGKKNDPLGDLGDLFGGIFK